MFCRGVLPVEAKTLHVSAFSFALTKRKQTVESETAYRKAVRAMIVDVAPRRKKATALKIFKSAEDHVEKGRSSLGNLMIFSAFFS